VSGVSLALVLGAAVASAQDAAVGDRGNADEPVTYQDVLKNPDDVAINYRYARRMIEAGELNRASAALERILITHPEADRIRLLYGIVLFRLGNDGEALGELNAVDRDALNQEDQATLDDILARIQRTRQRFRGSVGLAAGLHLDTNRNAFPSSGEFQVLGLDPRPLEGTENTDVGQFVLLDGVTRVRTPWQRVPSVTIEAAGLRDNQAEVDGLDTWSGLFGVATTYRGDVYDIAPRLSYRHTLLGGERYLSEGQGRLRVRRNFGLDGALTGFIDAIAAYENFDNVAIAPTADEQDGPLYGARIGVRATPTERLDLGLRYRFEHKDAAAGFESFNEHRMTADAVYVLTDGVSLSATAAYAHRDFAAPDPFITRDKIEQDHEYFGRVSISTGIDTLMSFVGVGQGGTVTDNLQITVAGQYRHVNSNIPNFAHENLRMETTASKRIPF
jgi:tetratricopeptide (TPR) repeat protein